MTALTQSGIRQENARAILRAIARREAASRAEIAADTGISLMTVGKVADALLAAGALCQEKPATGASGRRAGRLSLSGTVIFLVGDIGETKAQAAVFDLRLHVLDSLSRPYNDSLSEADNHLAFFRDMTALLQKHLRQKTLGGTGLCLPGAYDPSADISRPATQHTADLHPASQARQAWGFAPARLECRAISAYRSFADHAEPSSRYALSLLLDDGLAGCFLADGEPFSSSLGAPDFRALPTQDGRLLGHVLREGAEEDTLSAALIQALRPLLQVTVPDTVLLGGNRVLCRPLLETLPASLGKDAVVTTLDAHRASPLHGMALALRQDWTDRMLLV